MKNKGFSLVELIVVIAIMAILVGVAVPVYTSYIEKSQKAKDEQMIDEIKHALEIASAGQAFDIGEGGYIILSTTGVTGVEAGSNLDNVLKQTFGDDYQTKLALSYDSWGNTVAIFKNSSYYDAEGDRIDELLGTVTNLTTALSNFMSNPDLIDAIGPNFSSYLIGLGIDPTDVNNATAAGNAAALYVAQNTAGKNEEIQNAVQNALNAEYKDENDNSLTPGTNEWANAVVAEMTEQLSSSLGTAGGMAAMYGYAEAFGQYYSSSDNGALLDDFHEEADFDNVQNARDAVTQVENSFKVFLTNPQALGAMQTYTGTVVSDGKTQSQLDLEGYVTAMEMIDDSSSVLAGNLANTDAFKSTAGDLMNEYLNVEAGQVGIIFKNRNGILEVKTTIPRE